MGWHHPSPVHARPVVWDLRPPPPSRRREWGQGSRFPRKARGRAPQRRAWGSVPPGRQGHGWWGGDFRAPASTIAGHEFWLALSQGLAWGTVGGRQHVAMGSLSASCSPGVPGERGDLRVPWERGRRWGDQRRLALSSSQIEHSSVCLGARLQGCCSLLPVPPHAGCSDWQRGGAAGSAWGLLARGGQTAQQPESGWWNWGPFASQANGGAGRGCR